MDECRIPLTDNCIIAIHIDAERKKEQVIIDDMKNVRYLLRGYYDAEVVLAAERPIGSLIIDCFERNYDLINSIILILCRNLGKKDRPEYEMCHDFLLNLYLSDNLGFRFLGIRLWQEYNKSCDEYALRRKDRQKVSAKLIDTIEKLTLPFRTSIADDLLNMQIIHAKDSLCYLWDEYYAHPCGLLWSSAIGVFEYGFADVSLMPLIFYYLSRMYKARMYFQQCKRCDKLFIAKTPSKPTFCGKVCKSQQARENKSHHTEKTRNDELAKAYRNSYDYWYRRMKKLQQEPGVSNMAFEQAYSEFKAFSSGYLKQKNNLASAELKTWIIRQRDIIDKICDEHLDS